MVVKALTSTGQTHHQIANYLGITRPTLRKYFKEELKNGNDFIRSAVEGKLVQKALQGDRGCMFFLLERRFGWQQRGRYELTGADGKSLNFGNLPDDQLAQVIAALSASLPAGASDFGASETALPASEADDGSVDPIPE
jgi:hypothetical protein